MLQFLFHLYQQQNRLENKIPRLANADKMDKTQIAIRMTDKDKSRYFQKSEFDEITRTLSPEKCEKVSAKCDKNGDGRIDYEEFKGMMAMSKRK